MKLKILLKLGVLSVVFFPFQIKAQRTLTAGTYNASTLASALLPSPITGNVIISGDVILDNCGLELPGTSNLDLTSGNLYLRNGAQLVQGTGSTVIGSGILSVFQEGVANVHQFNYWCSPVGDPGATYTDPITGTVNGKFKVSMLGRPTGVTRISTSNATIKSATIATATDYDGETSTSYLKIASYWIYKFVSSLTYSQWAQVGENYIEPGYGFSMKGNSGSAGTDIDGTTISGEIGANNPDGSHQRYDFRGRPNNGDISIPTAFGKFTLIGNPYPSAIDLKLFFGDPDNIDTDQFAYYWEQGPTPSHYISQYTGGYGVYAPFGFDPENVTGPAVYVPATFFTYDGNGNPIACGGPSQPPCGDNNGGVGIPDRQFVPIGQGFMVKGDWFASPCPTCPNPDGVPGDDIVVMKNEFRVPHSEGGFGSGSVFSKKTEQPAMPQIRFATTYDNGSIGQMVQVFLPNSTEGRDKGKDALCPNNYPSMVNFLVADDRCVISTVPFDITRKLPLIFDNQKEANFKMTVKEMINLDQISNVYLHDKVSDLYMDIKNGFADITLPAGMNYEQYEITFQNNSTLRVNDLTENSFVIYQNNTAKKMVISNPMQVDIATCDLYDIAGKLVFSKNNLGVQSSYEFSTAELRDGIYITKITTRDNKTRSQKIIVKY